MAEMQTLKVDFSDIPDTLPAQPTRLLVDFSDIPDAVPQGEPEQTSQVAENPLSGKNILKVDFSDIPDTLPVQRKTLHVDFSDIPDREPDATGLVYYPVEYYDPTVGRFIQRDPVELKGGLNRYAYGANDQMRFTDPTGPNPGDPGTVAANANNASHFGSGTNNQASPGDQSLNSFAHNSQAQSDSGEIRSQSWFESVISSIYTRIDQFIEPDRACWSLNQREQNAMDLGGLLLMPVVGLVEGAEVASEELPQVLLNKAAGTAFRDEIADLMQKLGYGVQTEVRKSTRLGMRVIDIEVSKEGNVLGGIETKAGNSPYLPSQQAKDKWLRMFHKYIVNVVRDR